MDPPLLAFISVLILFLSPLHVHSRQSPHPQRPKPPSPKHDRSKSPPLSKGHHSQPNALPPPQHPNPSPKRGASKSPPSSKDKHHQNNALPPPHPAQKKKKAPPLPALHGNAKNLVRPPPNAGLRPQKGPNKSKANPGKKVGMLFLATAGSLQVAIIGFLGFRMWQIKKITNDQEFAL